MSKPPDLVFPKLPQSMKYLYKVLKPEKCKDIICNCTGVEIPISKCPCLKQSPELAAFYSTLPYRIQLINQSANKNELKADLYEKIMNLLFECKVEASVENSNGIQLTHLHHYIASVFGIPVSQMVQDNKIVNKLTFGQNSGKGRLAAIIPNLSVASNVTLLLLKIVAYIFSRSLSILTSLADSGMDILSGVVLLLATRVAQKGVPKGHFQDLPRKSNQYKFIYANRFESLGVIAFSAINSALSASLLVTAIENIVDITAGRQGAVSFEILPMCIMIITVVAKFILWAVTEVAIRGGKQLTVLKSFRNDHRNDSITNLFSFVGVLLASRNTKLALIDPCVSGIFLIYICLNWAKNCMDEMYALAGKQISKNEQKDIYIRFLVMYTEIEMIDEIINIVGYTQGSDIVLEITVNMKDHYDLEVVNDCIIKIEQDFESCDGIERCYVNCENDHDEQTPAPQASTALAPASVSVPGAQIPDAHNRRELKPAPESTEKAPKEGKQ